MSCFWKLIALFFLLLNLRFCAHAQVFSVEIIHKPDLSSDSSIYDIIKIEDGKYLMTGKNGYLQIMDSENNKYKIEYPSINSNLLKAVNYGDNTVVIGGTNGTLIIYNKVSETTITKQIPHFSNVCFYDLANINDTCLILAGGNNKIAEAKKRLPRGFIIETHDLGETWEYVYKNPVRMVWAIGTDSKNSIVASTYSPFNTKIFNFKTNLKQTFLRCKTLVHAIEIESGDSVLVLAGAKKHNYRNSATVIKINKQEIELNKELTSNGMFWGIKRIGNYYCAVGYGGLIYRIDDSGNIEMFDTQMKESLYELIKINDESFFVVGSNQTILKINMLQQTANIPPEVDE
jgi:hypothetical protein